MVKQSVPNGLAETLRRAIETSGLPHRQVALKARMEASSLSRFMRGERGLTVDAADRIAEALGLRLSYTEATPPAPELRPAMEKRGKKRRKAKGK